MESAWMRGGIDLSNGQVAFYKCTSEGNTPSHIKSINPTDSSPLRQLSRMPLGLAGNLGLGNCMPPTRS